MDSIAAHTRQSIQTLLVQHTSAPTQSDREFKLSSDGKTVLEKKQPAEAHSASLFSNAMAGLPSLPKVSVDSGKHA